MSKLKRIENVLLFLTLLFLPTQLGKHFWPEFSFIYSLPVDYLAPTIYFWDLLVVSLVTVWILRRPKINWLAFNLLMIFLLIQAVSLVGTVNIGAGLVRLEQYTLAGLFGIYLASSKLKTNNLPYFPLMLAVLFESVLAIAQFLKGGTLGLWILGERTFSISTPAIAKFDFQGIQFLRPYATFPHPNVLAAFMLVVSLLIGKRMVGFLAGLTTLLTFSRAAILAGAVAAFVLLNRKGRVVLMVVIIILSPILYTRFSSVFNFDNLAILRREELTQTAFKMFLSSPIFGVGLNNFIPKASDQLLVGPSRFLQPVHNIILLSLSETGIVGLAAFLSLIGYPIYRLLKLNLKPYPLSPLLLAWGIIIFLGMFDHYFLTLPQGYRLLFLVWGLSLSMLEWKK
ncbi:O-antigen ligase family protein [Candidatus Microgenomates bacterium]|nr:O-antigen ligase family protein [Candidatus Microgenomates bacterium]